MSPWCIINYIERRSLIKLLFHLQKEIFTISAANILNIRKISLIDILNFISSIFVAVIKN